MAQRTRKTDARWLRDESTEKQIAVGEMRLERTERELEHCEIWQSI